MATLPQRVREKYFSAYLRGYANGYVVGYQKGMKEMIRKLAQAMVNEGFDQEHIIKYTGLSKDELDKLV